MFTKKTNKKSENSNPNENENNKESSLKSWITGKLGSLLIFSAVGYALYKFGIIHKITSLFKKNKGKQRASEDPAASNPNDKSL